MKRATTLFAVLWLLGAVALPAAAFELPWASKEEEKPEGPPRPVVTQIVSDRDVRGRSVPGVVSAKNQVTLGFQTLGRLIEREVDLGDHVEAGDVLAKMNPDDLQDNVRAATAAVASAEVQLNTATATADRTRALARRNVVSTAQLEQSEQALAAAQAALDQARSLLVRAQDAQGFAQMIAPFAGVISAVYSDPGAVLAAGEPVLQLSDESGREAVIDLPEAALAEIGADAVFTIWLDNAPATETRATVDRIEPLADMATRTRRVHLLLDEDGAQFRLGTLIRARLAGETEIAMTLPEQAVFDQDGQSYVWRVLREGDSATVEQVAVDTGAALLGQVFIKGGLEQGEEVVIRGVASLEQGQQVGQRVEP